MSTGIIYFSSMNNTKVAAEYLAEKIGAKLVRLEGDGAVVNPLKGMLHIPSLPNGDPWTEAAGFDRLILMSPIYAFNGVTEVCGFLSKAALDGKQVMIIINGSGPDGKLSKKVHAQYAKLVEKAGGVVVGQPLYHMGGDYQKFAGDAYLHAQVDGIFAPITAWLNLG